MRENKLRTFLTGFAVAWGIFILIILLGSGNGLKNGITSNFGSKATNSMMVWSGSTTMPYKGYKAYRKIILTNNEINLLKARFKEIDKITGEVRRNSTLTNKKESGSYQILGVNPDYKEINSLKIRQGDGRFINGYDMSQERKVIVLSKRVSDLLFKDKSPIGKWIKVDGLSFEVIGVDSHVAKFQMMAATIPEKIIGNVMYCSTTVFETVLAIPNSPMMYFAIKKATKLKNAAHMTA